MDTSHVPFRGTRHEGISIHFVHREQASGRTVVFIRMEPGCGYPPHTHMGFEEVLVLQGGYRDELGEYREGQFVRYEDGTRHGPVALEDGPACVLFATAERGIEVGANKRD